MLLQTFAEIYLKQCYSNWRQENFVYNLISIHNYLSLFIPYCWWFYVAREGWWCQGRSPLISFDPKRSPFSSLIIDSYRLHFSEKSILSLWNNIKHMSRREKKTIMINPIGVMYFYARWRILISNSWKHVNISYL